MKGKDLLSVADLSPEAVTGLLESAAALKRGGAGQIRGKVLALLFEKPSLRTRVSFEVAMHQLGGYAIYLSPAEVGLGQRESVADVARVLSRYVSCLAARTFSQATLEALACFASVPVINALSDQEHPCQALSDLLTIREKRGELQGVTLAFVGDGNNVAHSLLLAAALTGMNFRLACPPGYEPLPSIVEQGRRFAAQSGGKVELTHDAAQAVAGADVVYTDVWTSMGQEAEAEVRRRAFARYQVNEELLALAKKDALVMHPLPAHHGEEVARGLLDGPHSGVFDQAENRLHMQKALLLALMGKKAV